MRRGPSETDLARSVVMELQCQGWTVYEEVDMGCRADIVARRTPLVAIVECKVYGVGVQIDQGWSFASSNAAAEAVTWAARNVTGPPPLLVAAVRAALVKELAAILVGRIPERTVPPATEAAS